jgi:hypothetical protein
LDIEQSPELYRAEHLFEEPVALVDGAPWLGKTWTARQLHCWLAQRPSDLDVGERLCLTEFGQHGAEQNLPPVWWNEWRRATPASPACWIIDALDEGEERLGGVRERILQSVGELDGAHRNRLRLVILSRQREWLSEFLMALGQTYDLGPLRQVPEFHLAPLHREAAREMLAAYPGAIDRVTALIRRFNLQPVAGYPAALHYLRQQCPDSDLTVVGVWRGLLQHLLREPDSGRRMRLRSDADERFTAAARIAAVLTLTGAEQVVDHTLPPGLPALTDIFPLSNNRALRQAARDACEAGPFYPTAEGGFRFAQRNVKDWLAAFGLAGLKIGQLQSALGDGRGQLAPRHRDLFPLLRQVSADPEAREWIDRLGGGLPLPSDLIGPTLAESLHYIDRLEQVVLAAPSAVRAFDMDLGRLSAPGLGEVLASRLSDSQRNAAARELLIEIALATDPYPVLPAAVGIVADATQPIDLRCRAMLFVGLHGGDAHFRQLAQPVVRCPANTRAEQQLRATVIRHLLERRLWNVSEAAAHTPPAEPHVIDDRQVLLDMLQERMTAEDARTLLRDRQRLRAAPRLVVDFYRDLDLLRSALDRLLSEDQLDEADERLLVEVALEWENHERGVEAGLAVLRRLGSSSAVRHRFYEHGIETRECDPASGRVWSTALVVADLAWLRDRLQEGWADLSDVWEDLYRLARLGHEAGQVDPTVWEETRRLVERHAPGVAVRFEENRRAYERVQQLHEQRMENLNRQRLAPTTLQEEVTSILGKDDRPADVRMRALSWLCFVPNPLLSHVTGDWEELDTGVRARVLALIRQGLEQGTPTPIPDGAQFPAQILCEAWAFLRLTEDPELSDWLTAEQVRRWLPTAVFALHQHIPAIVRQCAAIDQPATVGILLDAVERELRQGRQLASRAGQIPVEWWDNPVVTGRVTGWVQNESFEAAARVNLLGLLAVRAPQCACPVAAAWSELPQDGSPVNVALRRAGLNYRLVLDPEGAWPLVEADFSRRDGQALQELTALQGHGGHHAACVDLEGWPVARLEALARLLLRTYPIRSDPDRANLVHTWTATTELRDTRDRLLWILLSRDDSEARAAVDRLGAMDEGLAMRLRDHRMRQQAEGILGGLVARTAEDIPSVPLPEAIRLLDQAEYRLVRNGDDLLETVCEVLGQIERDIPEDLSMLYGKRPKEKGGLPEHLHEEALQAYLRRRLMDLLPLRVQGFKRIETLREDQIAYSRRLDLRIIASSLHTRELVTVIIEVKWSDNPETETSLTEQLGRKYLLGTGVNHGIYLVGWVGHWSRRGQAKSVDRAGLVAHLSNQRDEFCAVEPGKGLVIRPVVLDVCWRETTTGL